MNVPPSPLVQAMDAGQEALDKLYDAFELTEYAFDLIGGKGVYVVRRRDDGQAWGVIECGVVGGWTANIFGPNPEVEDLVLGSAFSATGNRLAALKLALVDYRIHCQREHRWTAQAVYAFREEVCLEDQRRHAERSR